MLREFSVYVDSISPDLLDRRSKFRLTTPGYEDIRAFVHKLFGRCKANAGAAASDERSFSFKLVHVFLSNDQNCQIVRTIRLPARTRSERVHLVAGWSDVGDSIRQ